MPRVAIVGNDPTNCLEYLPVVQFDPGLAERGSYQGALVVVANQMAQLLAMGEDTLLEHFDLCLAFRDRRIHKGRDVEPSRHRLGVRDAVGGQRKDLQMADARQPIDLLRDFLDFPQGRQTEDVAALHHEHQDQRFIAAELTEPLRQHDVAVLGRKEVDETGRDVELGRPVRHQHRSDGKTNANLTPKAQYCFADIIELHLTVARNPTSGGRISAVADAFIEIQRPSP